MQKNTSNSLGRYVKLKLLVDKNTNPQELRRMAKINYAQFNGIISGRVTPKRKTILRILNCIGIAFIDELPLSRWGHLKEILYNMQHGE